MRVPSRLGLGTWAFGGMGWGPQDDRDSIAAIHRAVELGVNWIDTAAVYGGGHSETIVGEALANLPEAERPLVFTKAGVRIDPVSGATYRDLSPNSLRAECEASLRRLKVERIDLFQLHWPVDDPQIVDQAWHTLGDLCHEGKIRWSGVSNFGLTLLKRCIHLRAVDSVQLPLSLLNRRIADETLPWAAAHGVSALVYSPLESGLLSGAFSPARLAALPQDDWRRRRPQFQRPCVERSLNLVELLRPIADGLGVTLVDLAIAWVLDRAGVTGAIVGARAPRQVDEWISAEVVGLDAQSRNDIAAALRQAQPRLTSIT